MSDLSSHDSSLDTTDSPSIDMDNHNNATTSKHTILPSDPHPHSHLNSSFPEDLKQETTNTSNNLLFTPNAIHNYDDLLFNTTNDINSNPMDFLMMDLTQQTSSNGGINSLHSLHGLHGLPGLNNINGLNGLNGINHTNITMTSPVLDFQNHLNANINITPSLNALTNGLFELNSNPNTPHLPPLNIDANSQQNTANTNSTTTTTTTATITNNITTNNSNINTNINTNTDEYPYPITTIPVMPTMPTIPTMPIINGIGDNIPPPTQDLDWQTFCTLINNDNHAHNNNNHNRKRKKLDTISPDTIIQIDDDDEDDDFHIHLETSTSPTKKRKLNTDSSISTISSLKTKKEKKDNCKVKKKKRGRPRKNPEQKVSIKKEKKEKEKKDKRRRKKRGKRKDVDQVDVDVDDDEYNMDEYLSSQYGIEIIESYVGIRTQDGEVRIQIPPNPKCQNSNPPKVKFTVFGNACSDKIEDILQPKKRTRYVRGLSEEEKKTRRREQNRNAAARSRARKNAMISKVIQLHQENMGLRAFVAENITQTKILRDEINRLNSLVMLQQQQQQQPVTQPQPPQSSLFDIINQDSSTLFQNK